MKCRATLLDYLDRAEVLPCGLFEFSFSVGGMGRI